ncbi:uncharacterized protein [Haliotis cracherodii]|uniref:uncharacterized protein n=1 Tax=Haliotis cracherodii TaxID=6455 RepID=UPI0039EB644F
MGRHFEGADMAASGKMLRSIGCVLFHCHLVLSQTTTGLNEVNKAQINSDSGISIETKVLGPLRVWHLVFAIASFLLTITTVVCCCCDFRIPRTRQEIEESYKKRVDNSNYIKYLDQLPQNVLKNRPKGRGNRNNSEDETPPERPKRTSRVADSSQNVGIKTKLTKGGQLAVATPLALHPGSVMEAMSKMRRNARSRPKQTAMAKAMTTLPETDMNVDT